MKHFDGTSEGISEAAKIVHTLRPDLYDLSQAHQLIVSFLNTLREADAGDYTGTGGFQMIKYVDEHGDVEYSLSYHILDVYYYSADDSGATVWCDELIGTLPKYLTYEPRENDGEYGTPKRYVDSLM